MLGELYKPKGLARETAQAVLEVKEPYAVNVALGCSNGCGYCYGPCFIKKSREEWVKVRHPKLKPSTLVWRQLNNGLEPEGVFMSFLTDVFLKENRKETEDTIECLADNDIRVATSSKLGVSQIVRPFDLRDGMTLVSLHHRFWQKWEPNTLHPLERIKILEELSDLEAFTWSSMEPYPCSAIWKQDLTELLEELKFVDLIVFGKWNYDKRANTEQARQEYKENIEILRDFCKSNHVRLHVKSDTLKFVEGKVNTIKTEQKWSSQNKQKP